MKNLILVVFAMASANGSAQSIQSNIECVNATHSVVYDGKTFTWTNLLNPTDKKEVVQLEYSKPMSQFVGNNSRFMYVLSNDKVAMMEWSSASSEIIRQSRSRPVQLKVVDLGSADPTAQEVFESCHWH